MPTRQAMRHCRSVEELFLNLQRDLRLLIIESDRRFRSLAANWLSATGESTIPAQWKWSPADGDVLRSACVQAVEIVELTPTYPSATIARVW
jgi:hypothetical protein